MRGWWSRKNRRRAANKNKKRRLKADHEDFEAAINEAVELDHQRVHEGFEEDSSRPLANLAKVSFLKRLRVSYAPPGDAGGYGFS